MAKSSPFEFLQQVRSEASKVTWPTRKETMITTAMVLLMIVVASLFFLFTDTMIRWMLALVLGIGRLVPGKGFAVAAAAIATLPADVLLVLVGEGPERAAIAAAGGARVRFLGALAPAQVAVACRAADALVLPSEREGWPNVVTEALASGLPVVASRVCISIASGPAETTRLPLNGRAATRSCARRLATAL
jgi:preprotein translocase subunit SecE